MKKTLLILLILLGSSTVFAQDNQEQTDEKVFSAGADIVSRYYWRGQTLADAPCIQPNATVSLGGFSFQIWGSYAFDASYSIANEVNFIAEYAFDLPSDMTVTVGFEDYYYPNAGLGFLNFRNHDDPLGPGAHLVAAKVQFDGPESFPLSLYANLNLYNDPGNNSYFEVSYAWQIEETGISVFAGVTPGSNKNYNYYFTDEFALVHIGATVSREIKITESFSLPVSVTWGLNPKMDVSHLVFGVTL